MRTTIRASALLMALSGAAGAACAPDRVEVRGDWGRARFTVEVADDPAERARGLMHVESLPRMDGMIFVYDRPQPVSFWMRNTLIPLDMLFVDAAGVVQRIHENAVPLEETPIPGGDDILAVLEINGGMTETLGIEVGSEMRHPRLPQDLAAWPCPPPTGGAAGPEAEAHATPEPVAEPEPGSQPEG